MTKKTSNQDDLACPSAPAHVGAKIFAATGEDGQTHHFKTPLQLTEEVFNSADARTLETKFRFSSTCQKNGCAQWENGKCAVAGRVLTETQEQNLEPKSIPPCTIRSHCRWYAQEGKQACTFCTYVVTGVYSKEISFAE